MGNPRNRARKTSRKRRAVTKETDSEKRQKCGMEFAQATNSGSRVSSGPSGHNNGETGPANTGIDLTPLSGSRRKLGDIMSNDSGKKEIEYPERNCGFFFCLTLKYYRKCLKVFVVRFAKMQVSS